MKAVVKVAPGEGNIELQDVPIPQIKPDEVLVAVKGTGLCGTDSLLYKWTYRGRAPVPTPIVLGDPNGKRTLEAEDTATPFGWNISHNDCSWAPRPVYMAAASGPKFFFILFRFFTMIS